MSRPSRTGTETRVLDDLRSCLTCADPGKHNAQCVSTHDPWVVGSSPTRPTGICAAQRADQVVMACGVRLRAEWSGGPHPGLPDEHPNRAAWATAPLADPDRWSPHRSDGSLRAAVSSGGLPRPRTRRRVRPVRPSGATAGRPGRSARRPPTDPTWLPGTAGWAALLRPSTASPGRRCARTGRPRRRG